MRFSAWVALSMVGCTGSPIIEPTDGQIVPTDDSSTDFVPPPPSNSIDAAGIFIDGFAAWDAETETFVSTVEGNGLAAQPPGILFTVADSTSQRFCQVLLTPAKGSMPPAAWPGAAGAYSGFELLPGEVEVIDGCAKAELPPEYGGDIGSHIAKWDWGFAVSELNEEIRQAFANGLEPSQWDALEPILMGGLLYGNIFEHFADVDGRVFEFVTVLGYELDKKGAIAVNGTGDLLPLQTDDIVVASDEIAPGYYQFDLGNIYIRGGALLLDVPEDQATGDTGATSSP